MSREGNGGGWAAFAATVFAIVGISNGIQGLGALFKKEYFSGTDLLYGNLQFWAWAWLIIGVLQIVAAYLLIDRARSGRSLGIVLAAGSAVVAFVSIGAYPLWSIVVLAMDLLIVFGLTTHPEAFGEGSSYAPGAAGSDPRSAEPPVIR
jgi:hypothetical protein